MNCYAQENKFILPFKKPNLSTKQSKFEEYPR